MSNDYNKLPLRQLICLKDKRNSTKFKVGDAGCDICAYKFSCLSLPNDDLDGFWYEIKDLPKIGEIRLYGGRDVLCMLTSEPRAVVTTKRYSFSNKITYCVDAAYCNIVSIIKNGNGFDTYPHYRVNITKIKPVLNDADRLREWAKSYAERAVEADKLYAQTLALIDEFKAQPLKIKPRARKSS
jgi:hypothetical protein